MAYCIRMKKIILVNKKTALRQAQGPQHQRWMTMR